MKRSNQIKVGKELITNSQEVWLGYYVFAVLTLLFLGGGYYFIRGLNLQGADYWISLLLVLTLSVVSMGICIMCHVLGHIVDSLDSIEARLDKE